MEKNLLSLLHTQPVLRQLRNPYEKESGKRGSFVARKIEISITIKLQLNTRDAYLKENVRNFQKLIVGI